MTSSPFLNQCQEVVERLPQIASKYFHIRTTEYGFEKIRPNLVQRTYQSDRAARGFGSRDNILKDRKRGVSTWKALEALALCLEVDGVGCAIIVHEKETAGRVFKIIKWAYERLPADVRADSPLNEDRRDAMEFGGAGSTIYVYTAGGRGVARSETIHWLHGSEVAFWPDPETTIAGAAEAVPRFGHITNESTPNGRENAWYDICKASREPGAEYKLYFFPWWWGEEDNSLPLDDGETIIPTIEEQQVIQIAHAEGFTIRPEHLKWRRRKLSGTPEQRRLFFQEHPEDIETCFLMSGNPIFDPEQLRRLVQHAQAKLVVEDIWMPGDGRRIRWQRARGKDPYVVVCDPAMGLPHGDWTVISTWQAAPQQFTNVARTKVKCSTDDAAMLIKLEAEMHHDALICVERNAIGVQIIRKLWDLGCYNQYHLLDKDGDQTDSYGWLTNERNKRAAVEEFIGDTNAGYITSWDPELWGEAMNVQRDEYGRPVTPKKRHDDIFMTAVIANMARQQALQYGGSSVASYA